MVIIAKARVNGVNIGTDKDGEDHFTTFVALLPDQTVGHQAPLVIKDFRGILGAEVSISISLDEEKGYQ